MYTNIKYAHLSDEALLSTIRSLEDRKAFNELYIRFFDKLFIYIHPKVLDKETTKDIIQDLFVNLWQRRNSLSVENVEGYLFKASKNLIISNYRKLLAQERQELVWLSESCLETNSTLDSTLANDLKIHYQEGLQLLPEKCQKVFVLSRNGFSNREVALQLGISEKTVEQHISKALRILKLHLKDHLAYSLPLLSWLYC